MPPPPLTQRSDRAPPTLGPSSLCTQTHTRLGCCQDPYKTQHMQVWELIIVGAGIAGSALAHAQANVRRAALRLRLRSVGLPSCARRRPFTSSPAPPHPCAPSPLRPLTSTHTQAGRRVLLLERCLAQPNRFVGELLQPGGYLSSSSWACRIASRASIAKRCACLWVWLYVCVERCAS